MLNCFVGRFCISTNLQLSAFDSHTTMVWNLNKVVNEDRWWNLAYELFLESDPITKILLHAERYRSDDNDYRTFNDYGFHSGTPVPVTGRLHDVSKKAILVVISRSRKMNVQNWIELDAPERGRPIPDLMESEKSLINCIIGLIYQENGDPRPFGIMAPQN